MKKSDKVMYSIIKIIGIIAIALISYFILFSIMNLMNTTEYSKILIDMNIYRPFYIILNFITQMAIPVFLIILFIAIPYLIVFLIIFAFFIRKYVKYNGNKKKQIIKIVILFILIICFVINGVSLLPLTTKYEIKVNARVNEVSNLEVRKFLQEEITGNESKNAFPLKSRKAQQTNRHAHRSHQGNNVSSAVSLTQERGFFYKAGLLAPGDFPTDAFSRTSNAIFPQWPLPMITPDTVMEVATDSNRIPF